jgi:hypothetical protein
MVLGLQLLLLATALELSSLGADGLLLGCYVDSVGSRLLPHTVTVHWDNMTREVRCTLGRHAVHERMARCMNRAFLLGQQATNHCMSHISTNHCMSHV